MARPVGAGVRQPVVRKAEAFERKLREVVLSEMTAQNLTWDALSQRSGVSRATIARILRGSSDSQRLDTIESLARALNISPAKFWA